MPRWPAARNWEQGICSGYIPLGSASSGSPIAASTPCVMRLYSAWPASVRQAPIIMSGVSQTVMAGRSERWEAGGHAHSDPDREHDLQRFRYLLHAAGLGVYPRWTGRAISRDGWLTYFSTARVFCHKDACSWHIARNRASELNRKIPPQPCSAFLAAVLAGVTGLRINRGGPRSTGAPIARAIGMVNAVAIARATWPGG